MERDRLLVVPQRRPAVTVGECRHALGVVVDKTQLVVGHRQVAEGRLHPDPPHRGHAAGLGLDGRQAEIEFGRAWSSDACGCVCSEEGGFVWWRCSPVEVIFRSDQH
jgi:hypothetical protein